MITIVFRTRLNPGIDMAELERHGVRMAELATAMPGFVDYKEFAAADGEALSLIQFTSLEALAAWRNHPEHLEAQRRGREAFFAEYQIQICELLRETRFP